MGAIAKGTLLSIEYNGVELIADATISVDYSLPPGMMEWSIPFSGTWEVSSEEVQRLLADIIQIDENWLD